MTGSNDAASDASTQRHPLQLAWPILPTMLGSCTAIPGGWAGGPLPPTLAKSVAETACDC